MIYYMNKAINQTFCMLKPDIYDRNLIGDVVSMLEKNHFKVIQIESKKMELKDVEEFYKDHKDKFFFTDMVKRIADGHVVGCILKYTKNGEAITVLRDLMGATNPANATEGTIRHTFAIDIDNNSIHGSDSFDNFERESKIFFKEK